MSYLTWGHVWLCSVVTTEQESEKLKAEEMWFYRRLLRVNWTDKKTNESVLEELSIKRQLLHEIDTRRLRYFRHAYRNTTTSQQ